MLNVIAILVLFAWLSGCAPKDPTKDGAFFLPQPMVKSQFHGREYDFNDSRLGTDVTLDAEDLLVLRSSPESYKLKIESECFSPVESEQKTDVERFAQHEMARHSPRQIRLLELLPPSAILKLKNKKNFICRIDFVASDSNGSTHKFSWPQIKIQAQENVQLKVQLPIDHYIGFSSLRLLHFDVDDYAKYQLLCDTYTSTASSFIGSIAAIADLAPNISISDLESKNLYCRILKLHPLGGVFGYSENFQITPDSDKLKLVSDLRGLQFDKPEQNLVLHRWSLLQSEPRPIAIEIYLSESSLKAHETIITKYYRNKSTQLIPSNFGLSMTVAGAAVLAKTDAQTYRAVIPPNTTASLSLIGERKSACGTSNGVQLLPENSMRIYVRLLRDVDKQNSDILSETELRLQNGFWIQGPSAYNPRNRNEKYSEPPGGRITTGKYCPIRRGFGI